jgi:hypothetical protein
MGLLDDAIREHLELKRLRGADPGEVAREEQDALGPVRREGEAEHDSHEPPQAGVSGDRSSIVDAEPAGDVDPLASGQETVEINMEAEFVATDDSERGSQTPATVRAAPVAHPAHMPDGGKDSLEWEVPGESPPDSAVAGQESNTEMAGEDGEHLEDVLQETPDFLRDTPEQERLWFEQRPPRDFDFDE